jgi:hypothetical protein
MAIECGRDRVFFPPTISFIANKNPPLQGSHLVIEATILPAWAIFSILTAVKVTGNRGVIGVPSVQQMSLRPISDFCVSNFGLSSICFW